MTALNAAKELVYALGLEEEDADTLATCIDGLVVEGPRTDLAVARTRQILGKVGTKGADLLKQAGSAIINHAVIERIFGP